MYETDIGNGSNPSWKLIKTKLQTICNANKTIPIKFSIYNTSSSPSNLYGEFITTVGDLLDPGQSYPLKDASGAKKGSLSF